jgi:hypothetical protein
MLVRATVVTVVRKKTPNRRRNSINVSVRRVPFICGRLVRGEQLKASWWRRENLVRAYRDRGGFDLKHISLKPLVRTLSRGVTCSMIQGRDENAVLRAQLASFKQRVFGRCKCEKLEQAQLPLKLAQAEEAEPAAPEPSCGSRRGTSLGRGHSMGALRRIGRWFRPALMRNYLVLTSPPSTDLSLHPQQCYLLPQTHA